MRAAVAAALASGAAVAEPLPAAVEVLLVAAETLWAVVPVQSAAETLPVAVEMLWAAVPVRTAAGALALPGSAAEELAAAAALVLGCAMERAVARVEARRPRLARGA